MTTADNIASLGLIAGFVHAAAIGLLDIVLPPPPNPLGGYGKKPKRRPQEEDEAFMFCALL